MITPSRVRLLSFCAGLLGLLAPLRADMVGEIRIFAGNFAPAGWAFCDGATLPISENETLFNLIGTTYGGDGQSTFVLPDLRGRVPMGVGTSVAGTVQLGEMGGTETVTLSTNQLPQHAHGQGIPAYSGPADSLFPSPATVLAKAQGRYGLKAYAYKGGSVSTGIKSNGASSGPAGGSQPFDKMQHFVALNYIIALFGIYPPGSDTPFLGSIQAFPHSSQPNGWLPCDGRLLAINVNAALFSLLGTTYGGNGSTNFALPDMRARQVMADGSTVSQGQVGGARTHTLTINEMPTHVHPLPGALAASVSATAMTGANGVLAAGFNDSGEPVKLYSTHAQDTNIGTLAGGNAGGNQPFSLDQPYLGLQFYIATVGIFPSPN